MDQSDKLEDENTRLSRLCQEKDLLAESLRLQLQDEYLRRLELERTSDIMAKELKKYKGLERYGGTLERVVW